MSDVFVAPEVAKPVKEKKKRAPMSEERKAVLREQLAKAREVKKAARLAAKAEKEAKKAQAKQPVAVPVAAPVVEAPAPVAKPLEVPPEPPYPTPATSDYKDEIAYLKQELASIKADKKNKDDKAELDALKAELKDIRDAAKAYKSAKAQKAKEAKDAKALQKKLEENHVASPAPHKPPPSLPIPVPEAPRYSTYRKSIWSKFK